MRKHPALPVLSLEVEMPVKHIEPTRENLEKLLGVEDILHGNRIPLNPKTIWHREFPFGKVEKVRIQLEPGVSTCLYICLPYDMKPPYQPFICVQGHTSGMHRSIEVDWHDEWTHVTPVKSPGFAVSCLKRGIPAVCIEQRYMGENSRKEDHMQDCLQMGEIALLRGRTIIGERVFDVDRTIDYLVERGDFDISKLGIVGSSGGGTTSMFAGAVLPRLTHVMPAACVSSFHASIGTIWHCLCNHIPNLYAFGESSDVLALIAPRPVVIVNGEFDDIFPIEATREEFAKLKRKYEALGAGDKCRLVVGNGAHQFFDNEAWDAMLPLWR